MAAATVPAKIVMKGTSQMSLHDRFTTLPPAKVPAIKQEVIMRPPPEFLMSDNNRRLARSMERRPNVMQALKFRRQQNVMQRLSAKARLGYTGYRGGFGFRRGFNGWRRNSYRGGGFRSGRGFWSSGFQGTRLTRSQWAHAVMNGTLNNLTRQRGGGYSGGGYRGMRGGRGRGGFRGRGRGRGMGRSPMKPPKKEELDEQLEQYMSKTKPHLDSELDTYMSELMA